MSDKKSAGEDKVGSLDEAIGLIARYLGVLSRGILSPLTVKNLKYDLVRYQTRRRTPDQLHPALPRIHLGCGKIIVPGWLNVDLVKSDLDLDLASAKLPWPDQSVEAIVSEHVIEHLEFFSELIPLFKELRRVCKPDAEVWLSCPDLEKVCDSYRTDKARALAQDKLTRPPYLNVLPEGVPTQHLINYLFHQEGAHKNLFDFELLEWALKKTGFKTVSRKVESDLLERFPGFPPRKDDLQTLYVQARP